MSSFQTILVNHPKILHALQNHITNDYVLRTNHYWPKGWIYNDNKKLHFCSGYLILYFSARIIMIPDPIAVLSLNPKKSFRWNVNNWETDFFSFATQGCLFEKKIVFIWSHDSKYFMPYIAHEIDKDNEGPFIFIARTDNNIRWFGLYDFHTLRQVGNIDKFNLRYQGRYSLCILYTLL